MKKNKKPQNKYVFTMVLTEEFEDDKEAVEQLMLLIEMEDLYDPKNNKFKLERLSKNGRKTMIPLPNGGKPKKRKAMVLFPNLDIKKLDRKKGRYLALNEKDEILSQGNDPKKVVDEARAKGCKCPTFVPINEFIEEKIWVF